ncbi:MAG: efflux RND transporter periplasmic adaptor subunit [Chloroflexi bacterium]|nr:efflux RND transporter periplasmic adaptor subunit [Chloroflexota bacterium]
MKKKTIVFLFLILILTLTACDAIGNGSTDIVASGTIAAKDVGVSPEIGGKVVEVLVAEGDSVAAGDVLLRVDDELLQANYNQAAAAVDAASATVDAANAQLASAEIQSDLVLQGARLQDMENRAAAWFAAPSDEIELPTWYYEKDEQIAALEVEVEAAGADLDIQLANLESELQDASNDDFVATETRLAETQAAFEIADLTLQQARAAGDNVLEAVAQESRDAALADLDAAQLEYDRMLSTAAANDVLAARAHVAVARARLDNAHDQLTFLLSGEQSLQVAAARAGVEQAKTAVAQAEANLAQAEAALQTLEIQIEKTVVRAPNSGVILSMSLSAGELVAPGSTVMTIGQLDEVELLVYVPEDQYGRVSIGQKVSITADSFPGETFSGQVQYIADQAEFTPRNVQTAEGRKSTVYAVKIVVPNTDQALKPGMPVDVEF